MVWLISISVFVLYCFVGGCYYTLANEQGWKDPEMAAAIWPAVILIVGPAWLGRKFMKGRIEAKKLQKALDEVRRKKDERDAADAAKTEYR
jgi:hypothetical protein